MKKRSKLLALVLLLSFVFSLLSSCGDGDVDVDEGDGSDYVESNVPDSISIRGDDEITLEVGDELQLIIDISSQKTVSWSSSSPAVSVSSGLIVAEEVGEAVITAVLGEDSDSITVTVIEPGDSDKPSDFPGTGEAPIIPLPPSDPTDPESPAYPEAPEDPDFGTKFDTDPYENMSKSEFYADYQPAVCYKDAYYRSLHGFMSGSIEAQDQDPTIAEYRPMNNGRFIRNSLMLYGEGGNAYYIADSLGNIVNVVFKGGAYTSLEDVAAYVFAFGDIPANHTAKKSGSPSSSIWGEYLRLNHSSFTGDVSRYPYEPELPNISGCGGRLAYKEIDIGTTGTDCDPDYQAAVYNDGSRIVRGAARIVYAKNDLNGNGVYEIGEIYVFYTNNHYNDFREYLNYEGGWGEIFGNVTGGGKISDKYECSPTPYVTVTVAPIEKKNGIAA